MVVVRTLPLPAPVPLLSSGVVGIEIIDTMQVIESAVRRCGKSPALLTAEDLGTAKTNLHLILASLSNRGLNLWAVDQYLLPLVRGQAAYTLPTGTEKIVNAVYREATRLENVALTLVGTSCSAVSASIEEFKLLGFKLPADYSGRLAVDYQDVPNGDWIEYHNFGKIALLEGWHWIEFDPRVRGNGVRIRDLDNKEIRVDDIGMFTEVRDRSFPAMNRDTYTSIPDKARMGRPNSYYFDKQINAELILWPVPETEQAQIVVWRQRRIQDVGSLAQKLEVPERWLDAITWALAKNLAFEMTGVAADRIALCSSEAANSLRDAELGEGDDAPLILHPNISGYTS